MKLIIFHQQSIIKSIVYHPKLKYNSCSITYYMIDRKLSCISMNRKEWAMTCHHLFIILNNLYSTLLTCEKKTLTATL